MPDAVVPGRLNPIQCDVTKDADVTAAAAAVARETDRIWALVNNVRAGVFLSACEAAAQLTCM